MADAKSRRNVNMLEGSLWDKILLFALPLAATGMLQQLFNAADVAVVGTFAGTDAMAAVGSNASVIGLFINLFVGVSIGATVVIARYTGLGRTDRIDAGVHTAIWMALVSGVALALAGQVITVPVLKLLSVPDSVMSLAAVYLRIYMAGMPAILLYNFEAAILRSRGDTRTTLICLVISGIVNVILNLFFVIICHMSAGGVAIATVIANIVSALLLLRRLMTAGDETKVSLNKIRPDRMIASQMLKIGVPAGIQGMVFSLSNMCVQFAINSLGSDAMAASSAAFYIEIMAYFAINAFGQAATTFIGQNYGAGNIPRCRKITRTCMGVGLGVAVPVSFILLYFGRQILWIFNSDPVIIEIGRTRLFYILAFEGINVLMEIFSGSLRGYGYSTVPALVSIFGVCVVRIFWVFSVFANDPTYERLMQVYPISWALTSFVLAILYFIFRRKISARKP